MADFNKVLTPGDYENGEIKWQSMSSLLTK